MLLEILGSLVKVDPFSPYVEIAHYSVHDYLVTPTFASDQSRNPYYLDLNASHGEILDSCIIYLNFVSMDPKQTESCNNDSLL